MKVSRLDKIIENNVSLSVNHNTDAQKIGLLQDISETLAMIYDKLCENSTIQNEETPKKTYIIPVDCLLFGKDMYVEYADFKEGDIVDFVRYDTEETIDVKKDEKKTEVFAVLKTHSNHEMRLSISDYRISWRCWSNTPTEKEKEGAEWFKK